MNKHKHEYPGFQKINIKFFHKFEQSPCDIYVHLSDQKHVKVLNVSDALTTEFILKYIQRGVEYFYLTDEDFEKHSEVIFAFTPAAQNMSEKGRDLSLPSHEEMNIILEEMGIDHKTIEEVQGLTQKVLETLKGKKELEDIFQLTLEHNNRFFYDHSYMSAVVSCHLAKKSEWGKSIASREKLSLAAIMHDLMLTHETAQRGKNEIVHPGVLQDVIDKNNIHPSMMAKKLRESNNIPSEVADIVENHHNVKQENLSELVSCFIVSHQFVLELYRFKFRQDRLKDIVENIRDYFTEGNLSRQATILYQTLLEKL